MIPIISPRDLYLRLQSPEETALVDIREQGVFARGHILQASCLPLGDFENRLESLIVRKDTQIILIGDKASDRYQLVERAYEYLGRAGFTDVLRLDGGMASWQEDGYPVFAGINTLSKAFGECVETKCHTPHIAPLELKRMLDSGDNLVVLDARPEAEFYRNAIPGAANLPGVELVYRIFAMVREPSTRIVVNCAGRTRSIIGAQSLINVGLANEVKALKNGTMGWHLAGLELEYHCQTPLPTPSAESVAAAGAAVSRLANTFHIKQLTVDLLSELQKQLGRRRNIYLLDVRTPAEYEAGHLPGSKSAPGGQLVQATDDYLAVRNGMVVLLDNDGVRATVTASWLIQMGFSDVYVLACGDEPSNFTAGGSRKFQSAAPGIAAISADRLKKLLYFSEVLLLDLSSSRTYRRGHIPGAVWLIRSRMAEDLKNEFIPPKIVVTSYDGATAARAGVELQSCYPKTEVTMLEGGTAAWIDKGYELETGMTRPLSAIEDVWYRPYELTQDKESAMREYLEWEVGLLESVTGEAGADFSRIRTIS